MLILIASFNSLYTCVCVSFPLFNIQTLPMVLRGNKDEYSLELKNIFPFFMCTRARYLPVNASVLLPLGRAVRDKGSGCVQFLKSNPFLPTFRKPTWHCGDYKEGQNLNCLQGIEKLSQCCFVIEMSHSVH